ncbi:MAG TPA: ABC transporter permease [Flavipsychrobacter sp.]|nr:ABC transporter permease [Flavipsychrobacter sp.]
MRQGHLILTSISQALQELRVNKLRTTLSLLGITIGIFCIIAVFTVVDSLKNNINNNMSSLGNDVLYINKKPWIPEETEYKWWEYVKRKPMTEAELDAVARNVNGVKYAALCYADILPKIKYADHEAESIIGYAVTDNFDKLQSVEIQDGRYLTASELAGGSFVCVIGDELRNSLFEHAGSILGKYISFSGKRFEVVGIMKKEGQNMAGFNFDNAVIYSYTTARSLNNLKAINWNTDPILLVKSDGSRSIDDFKDEIDGALRTQRKIRPGEKRDYAINQLSTAMEAVNAIFATVNLVGFVIAGFSLLVGGFGIANIMFVTVKERTKIIGLKKAIGAKPKSILMEFLIESVTLCLAGGIVGITVVLILSVIVSGLADFPLTLSLKNFATGVGISATVGVLAGIIPARAASKLDPVVAIRSH